MGRGNAKRKYSYLNNIKEEAVDEIVTEPQVEEIAIEKEAILEEKEQPIALYSVKVIHPSLRRRSTPEVNNNNIVGLISDQGIYKIYAEVGGWGKLEDDTWIMLQYTEKVQ